MEKLIEENLNLKRVIKQYEISTKQDYEKIQKLLEILKCLEATVARSETK